MGGMMRIKRLVGEKQEGNIRDNPCSLSVEIRSHGLSLHMVFHSSRQYLMGFSGGPSGGPMPAGLIIQ